MRFSVSEFDLAQFIEQRIQAPGEVHVSGIIRWMLVNTDPERYDTEVTEDTKRLWELGFIWEEVIGDAMARKYEKGNLVLLQPRVVEDGIIGHPDAFDLTLDRLREYKFTRKTARKAITDPGFRHWLWQIKAYLKMVNSLRCDLIIGFANGDYSDRSGMGPGHARRVKLRFRPIEIERNWSMLRRNRDRMLKEA